MTMQEIEGYLEGAGETPQLDFKAACSWSAKFFAPHILAMANTESGGIIVVGVEDKAMARQGVSAEQRISFVLDVMKDQMSSYADPYVDFEVEYPMDRDGKEYVVIKVREFVEVPIICKKGGDGTGTHQGAIYHRNNNRRPESAAISNSADMRLLIERAAVRMRKKITRLHEEIIAQDQEPFDQELGDL